MWQKVFENDVFCGIMHETAAEQKESRSPETPADMVILFILMKKDNVICNEKDLQLGTEYFFPEIGVRLWRERAFHPKLLKDPLYMEEMQAVLEDEYQYQYFQMVTVMG